MKMIEEYEKFGTILTKHKSGSHYILVPMNVVKFAGWKDGDELVIMAKKKEVDQNVLVSNNGN
jgi:hypothetical protein